MVDVFFWRWDAFLVCCRQGVMGSVIDSPLFHSDDDYRVVSFFDDGWILVGFQRSCIRVLVLRLTSCRLCGARNLPHFMVFSSLPPYFAGVFQLFYKIFVFMSHFSLKSSVSFPFLK